jgi:hypothetical protein
LCCRRIELSVAYTAVIASALQPVLDELHIGSNVAFRQLSYNHHFKDSPKQEDNMGDYTELKTEFHFHLK